jgi:hypothetical protein
MKLENATLGFRVKSGWAAVVLLAGAHRSPRLCDSRTIDLCDSRFPETRQPYHAAMGVLETKASKLKPRLRIVRSVTRQSVVSLLAEHRRSGYTVRNATLVVGSEIDPASIANPHIRAHALEGQLFRTALVDALRRHRVRAVVLIERDAYTEAAIHLAKTVREVQGVVQNLGRSAAGPWRAEQKFAALAAWIALSR